MGQAVEQFKERLKRGPQTFHKGFAVAFVACLVIAAFFAIYLVAIQENYLGIVGVIVAGISAVSLSFGIRTPNLDPLLEEIKLKVRRVVRDYGPLPPIQVARKLDYPDETILDAIRFLVEEGELQKNTGGNVFFNEKESNELKIKIKKEV
jgi:hypothetical protein